MASWFQPSFTVEGLTAMFAIPIVWLLIGIALGFIVVKFPGFRLGA